MIENVLCEDYAKSILKPKAFEKHMKVNAMTMIHYAKTIRKANDIVNIVD